MDFVVLEDLLQSPNMEVSFGAMLLYWSYKKDQLQPTGNIYLEVIWHIICRYIYTASRLMVR